MLHQRAIGIGRGLLARISEEYIVISEIGQFIIILTIVLASSFASFYFIEKPANVLVKKWFGFNRKKYTLIR
jgi:peptidoglycan/LPS O-acetylase OafA/YrhL